MTRAFSKERISYKSDWEYQSARVEIYMYWMRHHALGGGFDQAINRRVEYLEIKFRLAFEQNNLHEMSVAVNGMARLRTDLRDLYSAVRHPGARNAR